MPFDCLRRSVEILSGKLRNHFGVHAQIGAANSNKLPIYYNGLQEPLRHPLGTATSEVSALPKFGRIHPKCASM